MLIHVPTDSILGDPGAATRDDAIFLGQRYFRAHVYFEPGTFARKHRIVPIIKQAVGLRGCTERAFLNVLYKLAHYHSLQALQILRT